MPIIVPDDPKPSKNEEEYFARQNAELIESMRAERDRVRAAAERASHVMRCPRCGGHLAERSYHRVRMDVCPDCGGTWLDKGELEILEKLDRNVFRRFIADSFGVEY